MSTVPRTLRARHTAGATVHLEVPFDRRMIAGITLDGPSSCRGHDPEGMMWTVWDGFEDPAAELLKNHFPNGIEGESDEQRRQGT